MPRGGLLQLVPGQGQLRTVEPGRCARWAVAMCTLPTLCLTAPQGKYHPYSHLAVEKTDAQRLSNLPKLQILLYNGIWVQEVV